MNVTTTIFIEDGCYKVCDLLNFHVENDRTVQPWDGDSGEAARNKAHRLQRFHVAIVVCLKSGSAVPIHHYAFKHKPTSSATRLHMSSGIASISRLCLIA